MNYYQDPRVGLYIRLSRDDLRTGESMSVENQRIFLNNYAKEQGWSNVTEYVDDGYTGVNFDRPSFKRMMEDVKKQKINIIVCKDMSRFGRNYIQVGEFTDYILPSAGCALIALNDGVDTRKNIDNDMTPFRNLFNELYCKDISKKVKTGRSVRASTGKYLGTYAPMGYILNPENRYEYLIDETGAAIVKRIFTLRSQGTSILGIATILNQENVPTPRDYWYQLKGKPNPRKLSHTWSDVTIREMLKNEAYIGHMVQNKQGAISYKNRKMVMRPEEEWIRVENTHEPIIDMELWESVQALFKKNVTFRNNAMGRPHRFAGLLECADCHCSLKGTRDIRRKGPDPNHEWVGYKCGTYSGGGKGACSSHYIAESILIDLIKQDIQNHAEQIFLDEERVRRDLLSRKAQEIDYEQVAKKQRLKDASARLVELDQIIENLYEDRVTRKIPEDVFDRFFSKYENERKELVVEVDELQREVESIEQAEVDIQHWIDLIKKYASFEELERPMLVALIDKIIIEETHIEDGEKIRDIHIRYNFVGEVSDVL